MSKVSKYSASIILVFIIGFSFFFFAFKISYLPLDYSGDYHGYIVTAQIFNGEPGVEITPGLVPQRILKPLQPLLTALLYQVGLTYQAAFLVTVYFFFVACVFAAFFFFKAFFNDSRKASYATLLCMITYPMLRYGLDGYTETGALFFYIVGLYTSLLFLSKPSQKMFWANLIVASLGFLWKEYSILHVALLNIIILFHPELSWKQKISYILSFDVLFGIINGTWQLFVYFKYHYDYLSWYREGGAVGFTQGTYTFYNIAKSVFSLLMVGWIFILFSYKKFKDLSLPKKYFLGLITLLPCMVFLWGAISSRLFYVLVPALDILVVLGIERITTREWQKRLLIGMITLVHVVWAILTYTHYL
jgi:hypothetical protein